MGGVNVKNTIIEQVLQIVAPHLCSGCGKPGSVLCDYCKYDIVNEPFLGCILCAHPQRDGICADHASPIARAFVTSTRSDTLETLINRLKFEQVKDATTALAALLDETIPLLPANTQVVPIPTVAAHIRRRGYDQVGLIARRFSALRTYPYRPVISRRTNATQHIVDRDTRHKQAQTAFLLDPHTLTRDAPVLLLDDVITTGSTVQAAASLLYDEGFTVWVGALAYQTLD